MERLPGVLFHVDARQLHVLPHPGDIDVQAPASRQRQLVLRDLIALRQIGIEVVLAREDRSRLHVATEREGSADGEVDRRAIQDRQRSRKAQAHRTDVRIRWSAETRGTAAENLRRCPQLCVNLQPDDGLVGHGHGSVRYQLPVIGSKESSLDHAFGPASTTPAATSPANVLKFSTNIAASLRACAS
jgi:hypothetical protein